MKIAELPITPYSEYFLKIIKAQIKKYIKEYENLLSNLRSRYTEDQIEKAIDSIRISGYSIFAPTNQTYGEIIRTLEYGSSYVKSLKLISRAVRKVIKEGKPNEYVI